MSRPTPFQQASQLLQSSNSEGLEERLGLYQVFQRLYNQNPELLDELLTLESLPPCPDTNPSTVYYIIGCRQEETPCLTTNLQGGLSQTLYQVQNIWLLGRAKDAGLCLDDNRLSRHHAAIQFLPKQGFELVDLGSTNGSFVNGEAVRHRRLLREGDRIRIGGITINFFEQPDAKRLPELGDSILEQIGYRPACVPLNASSPAQSSQELEAVSPPNNDETMVFMKGKAEAPKTPKSLTQKTDQNNRQARLLNRLRQTP